MTPHPSAPTTSGLLGLGVLVVATVLLQLGAPEHTSRQSELARDTGGDLRSWASYDPYGREGRELDAEMNALMDRSQFDAVRLRWEALRARVAVRVPPHRHGCGYRISDECRRNPHQKACM